MGFAVGAVLLAAVVGGVLYALYPNGFNPNNTAYGGAASTAGSSPYGGQAQTTSTAASNNTTSNNSTANQNTTSQANPSSPQPTNNPGY